MKKILIMTLQNFSNKANLIIEAIKNGNYEECLEEPNFVEEYEHEGKLILIVVDTCNPLCGSCSYTVCDEKFDVTFELFDEHNYQSDFFDQAKKLKSENVDNVEEIDSIVKRVKDALKTLFPDFSSVDGQAAAYAKAVGITRDYEAYWYEDENSHWKDFIGEGDDEYEEDDEGYD